MSKSLTKKPVESLDRRVALWALRGGPRTIAIHICAFLYLGEKSISESDLYQLKRHLYPQDVTDMIALFRFIPEFRERFNELSKC